MPWECWLVVPWPTRKTVRPQSLLRVHVLKQLRQQFLVDGHVVLLVLRGEYGDSRIHGFQDRPGPPVEALDHDALGSSEHDPVRGAPLPISHTNVLTMSFEKYFRRLFLHSFLIRSTC